MSSKTNLCDRTSQFCLGVLPSILQSTSSAVASFGSDFSDYLQSRRRQAVFGRSPFQCRATFFEEIPPCTYVTLCYFVPDDLKGFVDFHGPLMKEAEREDGFVPSLLNIMILLLSKGQLVI